MIRRLAARIGDFFDRSETRWTIGVALPIVMIVCDPAVFHSRVFGVGMPILGPVKPFSYTATALAVVTLAVWLVRRRSSAFASGVLGGAAAFAAVLGMAILPFSLLGILFLGLGLLGLSPFLMAVVYARAATAAFKVERGSRRWLLFGAGVLAFIGLSGALQAAASRAFHESVIEIGSGEAVLISHGTRRLQLWSPVLDLERLVAAYTKERDPGRQAGIAAAYQELTGQDAAQRAAELLD
jgi:hypothetical protein